MNYPSRDMQPTDEMIIAVAEKLKPLFQGNTPMAVARELLQVAFAAAPLPPLVRKPDENSFS